MIAAINQGSQAPLCAAFPSDFIPFSEYSYTTGANVFGDRLVVGILAKGASEEIGKLSRPAIPNQTYCDQVQLAPGVYVNAHVPKDDERNGNFHPDYQGLLVDPASGVTYSNGSIGTPADGGIFAWRISSEPVHTILTLASPLVYKYDASTVTLYGNVVNATHGQTVAEVLGNGDASQAFKTFALHRSPQRDRSALKALDRLVGVEDYSDFARTFAGIGKAAAARLSDGRRQLVDVTIAGADDIPIDVNSDLYRNLVQALHQYGDPYLPFGLPAEGPVACHQRGYECCRIINGSASSSWYAQPCLMLSASIPASLARVHF
jgi:hypothetical protein